MKNTAAVQNGKPVRVDEDFHAWLIEQASLLRNKRHNELDWKNLANELEDMAGAERWELLRRLATLFEHLLKLQYEPEIRRERGRKNTIAKTRSAIDKLLRFSPGLKGSLEDFASESYGDGCRYAGTDL